MHEQLHQAIIILRNGGIVAFPTETVYGLGADAGNEDAIRKVFTAKGRPLDHPLIVHIATAEALDAWAINIPDIARMLAKTFWPGPLTLVLQKRPNVSTLITGGLETVALRVPQHPLALQLLQQLGSGLVGPSANMYGSISPTSAHHVHKSLGTNVDYILDGGNCEIGIESTIVDVTQGSPKILRKGAITLADIHAAIGYRTTTTIPKSTTIRVPGTAKSHYAPTKPLYLVSSEEVANLARLGTPYCFLAFQPRPHIVCATKWLSASNMPELYAKKLYAYLHELDTTDSCGIVVEKPPAKPAWEAVVDRLTRASQPELPPLL